MRPVGVEVLENVEVDFALVGFKALDELAAALDQLLEIRGVILSDRHLRLPYDVPNFAARPSRVAFPRT
jgi:hypothetical protein